MSGLGELRGVVIITGHLRINFPTENWPICCLYTGNLVFSGQLTQECKRSNSDPCIIASVGCEIMGMCGRTELKHPSKFGLKIDNCLTCGCVSPKCAPFFKSLDIYDQLHVLRIDGACISRFVVLNHYTDMLLGTFYLQAFENEPH